MNHYTSIPTADYMRAGLWRFPITQMRDYGEKIALRPIIINAQDGDWGAYWDAGINENASTGENRGSIVMFSPNRYAHQLGSDYSHEFNHSMSNPAISSKKYVRSSDSTDIFNHSKKWLIAPSSGLFSPMYGNYDKDGDAYANAYGENGIRPSLYAARVPATGSADDYSGYLMPDAVPANPVFRRYPVLDGGKSIGYMDRKHGGFWYNYAYNHNEMTQGLISLNRAQHLLQQNIKKNPQAYIDAGVDPAALEQFMQLPTFLKSPAQLDQRMEFYHNNPEFIHLIGLSGPGQIIPRYFMLERERRNPDQSQEWRDYHQDLFNFTRANYFMARNGSQRQNPMNTGMGRLYNKLA